MDAYMRGARRMYAWDARYEDEHAMPSAAWNRLSPSQRIVLADRYADRYAARRGVVKVPDEAVEWVIAYACGGDVFMYRTACPREVMVMVRAWRGRGLAKHEHFA